MAVHKHQTQISEVSPLNTALVNREHKPRVCWHCQPFQLICQYKVEKNKKGIKKEGTDTIW